MDLRILICTCVAYLLPVLHHASATCKEQCSIECPSYLTAEPSTPFYRYMYRRRSHDQRCRRVCSYVCLEGRVLEIPRCVHREGRYRGSITLLLPFPFAVEFYDQDGDEQISFSEFVSTVKCNESDPSVSEAFALADTNGDELVTRQELLRAPFQMCLDDDDDWEEWDDDRHHRRHGHHSSRSSRRYYQNHRGRLWDYDYFN